MKVDQNGASYSRSHAPQYATTSLDDSFSEPLQIANQPNGSKAEHSDEDEFDTLGYIQNIVDEFHRFEDCSSTVSYLLIGIATITHCLLSHLTAYTGIVGICQSPIDA